MRGSITKLRTGKYRITFDGLNRPERFPSKWEAELFLAMLEACEEDLDADEVLECDEILS